MVGLSAVSGELLPVVEEVVEEVEEVGVGVAMGYLFHTLAARRPAAGL